MPAQNCCDAPLAVKAHAAVTAPDDLAVPLAESGICCDAQHRLCPCGLDNKTHIEPAQKTEEVSMRITIFGSAILAGVLLASIADSRVWSPALAEETLTPIENAPCGWFTRLYPGAWGTDHKIQINPRISIARISFGPGTYQLADGTDAYDYLEQRCGDE
jgi:hypothetical protein